MHLLEVARLWSRVVAGVVSDVYLSRRTWESKSPCAPARHRPPTRYTSQSGQPSPAEVQGRSAACSTDFNFQPVVVNLSGFQVAAVWN